MIGGRGGGLAYLVGPDDVISGQPLIPDYGIGIFQLPVFLSCWGNSSCCRPLQFEMGSLSVPKIEN